MDRREGESMTHPTDAVEPHMTPTDYTAMTARLRMQLVMSMFFGRDDLYREEERQREEAADAIDALATEVTRLREAGQEAALQVLASDGQAQEALDRALAAEARVKELEGALINAKAAMISARDVVMSKREVDGLTQAIGLSRAILEGKQ